jgi:tripartite-type tricarboxylate transporter receptor subunit TctC
MVALLNCGLLMRSACALGLALWLQPAAAQQPYPARPITLIVAFAPGGVADGVARIFGQKLGERLGQRVSIENRGGAGGNLAAKMVAAAEPDGHTLLVTTTAVAINETLYKHKGYETADLRAIAIAASTPEVIIVNANNPARTLTDLLAAARSKSISFGSAGVGSGSYIAAEFFFKKLARVEATHIPFQGGAPALNALMGNHIDVLATSLPPAVSQINQGLLRGVGIASPQRSPVVPEVPTFAEGGFPQFLASSWVAFLAPARTDAAIVRALNAAIQESLREADVQAKLEALGFETLFNSGAETEALFKSETETWGNMVRSLGLGAD